MRDWRYTLPQENETDKIPKDSLHLTGQLLALFESFDICPFRPQSLIVLAVRPPVPRLFAIRCQGDVAYWIAQRIIGITRDEDAPTTLFDRCLVCSTRNNSALVAWREFGIHSDLAQGCRQKLRRVIYKDMFVG